VSKHGSAPSRSIDQVLCQFDEHQSAVQSLSSTLKEFRVTDEQTRIKVEEEIRRQSEAILQAIVDSGNNSAGSPESLTQTDFVGRHTSLIYVVGLLLLVYTKPHTCTSSYSFLTCFQVSTLSSTTMQENYAQTSLK